MPLNFIEKSPELGAMLVRLHDRHASYKAAENPSVNLQDELAFIIDDLVSFDLSINERELITDVLVSLIDKMELQIKQAVSHKLSSSVNAPLRIILHLANENISVAEHVLRNSKILEDQDLIYIAKSQPVTHSRVIAQRKVLGEHLVNVLAETNDVETAIHLANNSGIVLTPYAVELMADLAAMSEKLSEPLSKRSEVSHDVVMKLYEVAGKSVKQEFCDHDIEFSDKPLRAVDDAVKNLQNSIENSHVETQCVYTQEAKKLLRDNKLSSAVMLQSLRCGESYKFLSMFAIYCGLPVNIALSIIKQDNGQGLALACKANGISKADFVNMFLLSSKLRGGRITMNQYLSRALQYYEHTTEAQAQSILKSTRH